jgi:hypothetical protein
MQYSSKHIEARMTPEVVKRDSALPLCIEVNEQHELSVTKVGSLLHRLIIDSPQDVLSLFLSQYLALVDLVQLDNAISERRLRKLFLSALSAKETLFCCKLVNVLELNWFVRKQLSIDRLVLRNVVSERKQNSPPLSPHDPSLSRQASQSPPTLSRSNSGPLSPFFPVASRSRSTSVSDVTTNTVTHTMKDDSSNAFLSSLIESPRTSQKQRPRVAFNQSTSPPQGLSRPILPLPPIDPWDAVLMEKKSLQRVLAQVSEVFIDANALRLSTQNAVDLLNNIGISGDRKRGFRSGLKSITLRGFKKLKETDIIAFLQRCCFRERDINSEAEVGETRLALKSVDLSGSWQVSDGVMQELSTHSLQSLDLSACFNVTTPSLLKIVSRCPSLTMFRCNLSESLTDLVVRELLVHCKKLQHLSLSGCVALTDTCAESIVMYDGSLRYLDLSGVKLLTDEFLSALALFPGHKHNQLLELSLEGCPLITTSGVRNFLTRYRVLQKLNVRACTNIVTSELQKDILHNPLEHCVTLII